MPDARTLAEILCNKLSFDELEILREDPLQAIPLIDSEVTVRLAQDELGGGCSVEGLYQESTRSITVQQASSQRRTRFTAIHEFGHDRARRDGEVAHYLASFQTGQLSRRAEERIADAFAATILIPNSAVDEVLNGSAPSPHHVVELFHRSDVAGSREACCVRIAQRMTGNGYVVLAEGNRIQFCAVVGGAYPIRRRAAQPTVGLLRNAAEHGAATDPNSKLQFSDGRFTVEYAGKAIVDDIYTFAVLTDSSNPPWGGWIPPRRSEGDLPEVFCKECDEVTEAWQRCDESPAHRVCGACGWCECRAPHVRIAEQTCDECTLRKRVDLFPDGGTTCCDCL